MNLEKARNLILNDVYSGFCFKDEQSKTHVIAGLLTPYLRGIIGFSNRIPLWFFMPIVPVQVKIIVPG